MGVPGRPVQILLVEDNLGDVRLTQLALREGPRRKEIHVVGDGESALEFLHREGPYANAPRPDLILLDLNLPRRSGHEVLHEIKQDPALRTIPTVILTTSDRESDVRRSYELAANCFITKPLELEGFVRTLKTVEDFWVSTATLPYASADA
jgi:chemotaxis family two-component system response regulator Rcp1